MDITQIGQSFPAHNTLPDHVELYNVMDAPFELEGLYKPKETGKYLRLPEEFLPECTPGIQELAWHTTGGRVRFATDSPFLVVAVELRKVVHMLQMPRTGNSGVDVYFGPRGCRENEKRFCYTMRPNDPFEKGIQYADVHTWRRNAPREITLNLPLYNGVNALQVGVAKGSNIWAPTAYSHKTPIVFYGSSITQGGCVSRPGNCYTSHVSRWLDSNFICLGFPGCAKGEESMARHIAGREMSAFVLDYDHNAPSLDHLRATHEPFFKIIRQAHPNLPILIISKPDFDSNVEGNKQRRDTVMRTYLNAIEAGDKNVSFVDGELLFGDRDRDACTVEGCHPNDLGFYRMAKVIYPKLRTALGLSPSDNDARIR